MKNIIINLNSIYFKKEDNGNVTIRSVSDGGILYSLPPTQVVSKDSASENNIIIKSAIGSTKDKGIVIKVSDIALISCEPPIYLALGSVTNLVVEALATHFFFELGKEIHYGLSFNSFPSIGDSKILYIDLQQHKQYYWSVDAYYPYSGDTLDFSNILLSNTEFKKTFWLDFSQENLVSEYGKQKIDISFGDASYNADITVNLQAEATSFGSITKKFVIGKTYGASTLLVNKSSNGLVVDTSVLNLFGISEMAIVGIAPYFTISNKLANTYRRVKLEIHYKTGSQDPIALKGVYDSILPSAVYKSSPTLITNNETRPSLPYDSQPHLLNSLVINPSTKEIKEAPPFTSLIRISKEIVFQDSQYNYIGRGDYLDTPDTTNTFLTQIIPSNNLISFIGNGQFRNLRLISTDQYIEVKFYLYTVTQVSTSNGFITTLSSPTLLVTAGNGFGNYTFASNPNKNFNGGTYLAIGVKSTISTPRTVVIEGVLSFTAS